MEIIQTDQTKRGAACIASIAAASLLILGGLALLVYYISASSGMYAIPVWQFSLYALSPLVPILAGGVWLNAMYRRGKVLRDQGMVMGWKGGGLAFGLLLILVGLFMLGFATDAIDMSWRPVFISWQMLIIVLGLFETCKGGGHVEGGLIAILVCYFFLIPRIARTLPGLIDLPDNFTSIYWPALLIAVGVAIVIGMITRPRCLRPKFHSDFGDDLRSECRKSWRKEFSGKRTDYTSADKSGKVQYELIFGAADQVFLDEVFNGGKIDVIFGGVKLDLRNTKLPEGTTYFEISAIFGGIDILAPADWDIELRRSAIFGNFNDNRRKVPSEGENKGRLIIDVSCIFGGGEIH